MNSRKSIALIAAVFLITLISVWGCATKHQPSLPVPAPPPKAVVDTPPQAIHPDENNGSLWQNASSLNSLFQDTKSRRLGDIVTVRIDESSKATNKADTKTGRGSSVEAGIQNLFGLEDWWQDQILTGIGGDWPKINPFGDPSLKANFDSEFDGSGTTTRSGDLTAYITCRVTDVLPNGNLRIVGSRELLVNHENQLIILSGVIRPRDIKDDNTIMSIYVSDAKIAYSGSGVIDDRQRPGWLSNALNTVWPF